MLQKERTAVFENTLPESAQSIRSLDFRLIAQRRSMLNGWRSINVKLGVYGSNLLWFRMLESERNKLRPQVGDVRHLRRIISMIDERWQNSVLRKRTIDGDRKCKFWINERQRNNLPERRILNDQVFDRAGRSNPPS